jgi:hypothetical protein
MIFGSVSRMSNGWQQRRIKLPFIQCSKLLLRLQFHDMKFIAWVTDWCCSMTREVTAMSQREQSDFKKWCLCDYYPKMIPTYWQTLRIMIFCRPVCSKLKTGSNMLTIIYSTHYYPSEMSLFKLLTGSDVHILHTQIKFQSWYTLNKAQ